MKKQYIIPEMTARQVNFQMNLCVGSVRSNLNIQYIGNTGEDPI